jgi:hypothetical protein
MDGCGGAGRVRQGGNPYRKREEAISGRWRAGGNCYGHWLAGAPPDDTRAHLVTLARPAATATATARARATRCRLGLF